MDVYVEDDLHIWTLMSIKHVMYERNQIFILIHQCPEYELLWLSHQVS